MPAGLLTWMTAQWAINGPVMRRLATRGRRDMPGPITRLRMRRMVAQLEASPTYYPRMRVTDKRRGEIYVGVTRRQCIEFMTDFVMEGRRKQGLEWLASRPNVRIKKL